LNPRSVALPFAIPSGSVKTVARDFLNWGLFRCEECENNKAMKRVNILIEIRSQIEGLDSALKKGPEKLGKKVDLPATAVFMPVQRSKGKEGGYTFQLSFGINLAPVLLANWLYEKINGRATKLLIDRTEVPIDKNEIERVITAKIGEESKLPPA
jgi:hypothetical protein